jgi:hypothetical protein
MISGIVILVGFFLPWVDACGRQLSGYDLANEPLMDNHSLYWLVFLGGAACVALYFAFRGTDATSVARASTARLIASLIGVAPIVNLAVNLSSNENPGLVTVMYGGVVVALGYIGAIVSFFVDRSELATRSAPDAMSPPSDAVSH